MDQRLGNLRHQSLHHGCHRALNFRGQGRSEGKLLAFNAVNQQGLGQAVHRARQFDRFAHPESMSGTGEDIFREPLDTGIPYLNLARFSAGGSGVDENDVLKAGPAVHQREAFAAMFHDFDGEGFDTKSMQAACDQQTSRVVTAVDIAAADDAKGHV